MEKSARVLSLEEDDLLSQSNKKIKGTEQSEEPIDDYMEDRTPVEGKNSQGNPKKTLEEGVKEPKVPKPCSYKDNS